MKKIVTIICVTILILISFIFRDRCLGRTGGEDSNPDLLTKIGQLMCPYTNK